MWQELVKETPDMKGAGLEPEREKLLGDRVATGLLAGLLSWGK